jgi:hypothetical protein
MANDQCEVSGPDNCDKPDPPRFPYATHLVIRASPEAHLWVKNLADHCSLRLTDLIWQSLLRMAEATGYHAKVPPRYRGPRYRDGLRWHPDFPDR